MFGLRPNTSQSLIASALLALSVSSCSLSVEPMTQQCSQDGDCARLGFANFECVESLCVEKKQEEAPPVDQRFACAKDRWPEEDDSETVNYEFVVTTLMGAHPYKGMTVYVCPSFDLDCEEPEGKAVSDSKGRVSFDLPLGFRGHLYLPTPEEDPSVIPLDAHVFPPPSKNQDAVRRDGMVVSTVEVMKQLAKMDGATVVPGSGHLSFTALGCDGYPLDHVEVQVSKENDDTWHIYAGVGGVPDPHLNSTGPSGRGAILNLPLGYCIVTASHPDYGKIFEQAVVIKKDGVTSVPIVPSFVP